VDWQVDPSRTGYEAGFPANTFRWIRIEETATGATAGPFDDFGGWVRQDLPRIRAEKKEGNLVEVKTHRVKRFTLLVSDAMFDLAAPIEVTVNGKPAFKDTVKVDARTALEEMRLFNDRRLVFSARITIEVE
jgi:hypothetical protein